MTNTAYGNVGTQCWIGGNDMGKCLYLTRTTSSECCFQWSSSCDKSEKGRMKVLLHIKETIPAHEVQLR